jgi:hypothetical protein
MGDPILYNYPAWANDPYGPPQTKELAQIRDACRKSLKYLAKEILGMSKWDDDLHDDLAAYLEKSGKHKLILIPRGHLKSSIVTIAWTIQQLLRNPNTRVLIRNAVWDQSRRFLGQIQGYLEDSELPTIFGAFHNAKVIWTKEECEIAQRKVKKASPTIMTAGIETSLTGLHFDIIVDDDLVNDKNTSTKEQIQKVIDVYNDSFNLLDRGGQHVVIGTRWNHKDLYGHILSTDTRSVNLESIEQNTGADAWRNTYNKWVNKRLIAKR